jgi:hypothetical protein
LGHGRSRDGQGEGGCKVSIVRASGTINRWGRVRGGFIWTEAGQAWVGDRKVWEWVRAHPDCLVEVRPSVSFEGIAVVRVIPEPNAFERVLSDEVLP